MALLLAVRHQFELECLESSHRTIVSLAHKRESSHSTRSPLRLSDVGPLAFVTEYRCDAFIIEILDDMCGVFSGVCRNFAAERVEFGDEDDHVHLLEDYPPKVASKWIQVRLKSHDPTGKVEPLPPLRGGANPQNVEPNAA
ncbi:hypothetical protein DF044_06995 [Burkholderia contaminans]|nr:hypothetical protein DF044_06995 [Burkholderia contaminans]